MLSVFTKPTFWNTHHNYITYIHSSHQKQVKAFNLSNIRSFFKTRKVFLFFFLLRFFNMLATSVASMAVGGNLDSPLVLALGASSDVDYLNHDQDTTKTRRY